MKHYSSTISAVAAIAALLGSPVLASAQSILKTAGNYSVLASQAVTVAGTGFTITNGNVGLFPAATSNITGFPPGTVSGTTLLGTAAAIIATGGTNQQAQADLQVAATGLAGMAANANESNIDMANLGPLPPGVYKWNAAATLTGALVLNAQGKNNVFWVFQFGTGLTTAVNSTVTVINAGSNGGSDDGIFWNAATGAIVIGNNNTVLGNYLAGTSISFTGSTQLLGGGGARFLALNAAVTFAGPGALSALGGPGGSDWTGGLTLSGSSVVATSAPVVVTPPVVVVAPPVIAPVTQPGTSASTNMAVGASGSAFVAVPVTASGSPTSFSATGLPPGLSINTQTGAITGTPTTPGTYVATIGATNAGGTGTSTLTFVISAPPISVTVASDLVGALATVNANAGVNYTINFTGAVTLGAANVLPAINTSGSVTINGGNFTLDGGGVQRGFFVSAGTVTIQNLTIQNTLAQGGLGANGGGGGLGAGGALFMVPGTNVTVNNVTFGASGKPDQAFGGNGGGVGATGGAGGGIGLGGFGGGLGGTGVNAGAGGFGGGGGGSTGGSGGAGGLGGGGGGGNAAGLGGFGGGNGSVGSSGFTGLGGGGLGAGGAIFASGGNLTVTGPIAISGNGVTAGASGGLVATAGSAFGSGIFLSGNDSNNGGSGSLLTFAPIAGVTQTISDVIADQAGNGGTGGQFGVWGLTLNGAGTLVLSGANTFSGGVTVNNGMLAVNNASGSGSGLGPVTVANGATVAGTGRIGSSLTAQAGSFLAPGTGVGTLSVGGSVTWNGNAEGLYTLSDSGAASSALAITGALTKGGSGTYVFNFQNTGAAPDTYTLATFASTNFSASNFTYLGLPTGLTGTFVVSGTQLQFAVATASGTGTAPVITSSSTKSNTSGTAFSYSITATNTPTSYGMSGALPTGLTLNTSTGVISGMSTQTGTFSTTISATNTSGSGTEPLIITMAFAPAAATPAPASSGGGGGAPSYWFYGAVALVILARLASRRQKAYSA